MTAPAWQSVPDQTLQFGHSVAAVDDRNERGNRRRMPELQFGHSVAAVDDLIPHRL